MVVSIIKQMAVHAGVKSADVFEKLKREYDIDVNAEGPVTIEFMKCVIDVIEDLKDAL